MDINIGSDTFITLAIQATSMNTSPSVLADEEYIRAAPDSQLSSSNLLSNLLKEEDQYHYNQLLNIRVPHHIQHTLHQLCSFLHSPSSVVWMATVLLKKLIILQHSFDLLTVVAAITLSSKYQHSSSHIIDYQLLAQYCHIDNIQQIHNTELDLLDVFSYDICVITPDHFFSYLSNLNNDFKQIVQQIRSFFSVDSLSYQTFELLHNYPSSIIAISLMYNITSNTFILQYIKTFLQHKKDPSHYLNQLIDCIIQLQSIIS